MIKNIHPHIKSIFSYSLSIYYKYRKAINFGLLFTVFILIFINYWQITVITSKDDLDPMVKVSSLIRDFVYVSGIIIAGTWSYYIFIKGRTFEPRAKLEIRLK